MRQVMLWITVIAVSAGVGGCGSGGSISGAGGKMLVSINGKTITEGDLDFLATINPRLKAQTATPFGQKQILDNLVEQELLYQESVRRGLHNDKQVKAKAELYRRVIVAQAALDDTMEKDAKAYFDEHKNEFEKLEVSHLLIRFKGKEGATRSEAQALALANDLKERSAKGEEFAKLAKEYSEDAGSKTAGGMLGKVWKAEPRLERRGYGPLLEQAFTMKVGEVGGPIKTEEGYHLITVTKGVEVQLFDDAKQAILFKLQGDIRRKVLADLKQKAKIAYGEGIAEEKKPGEAQQPPTASPPPAVPAPQEAPQPVGEAPKPVEKKK